MLKEELLSHLAANMLVCNAAHNLKWLLLRTSVVDNCIIGLQTHVIDTSEWLEHLEWKWEQVLQIVRQSRTAAGCASPSAGLCWGPAACQSVQ